MIRIDNLSVTYRGKGRTVEAVKKATLDIERGRITSLVGESGSGKSTLLMAIPSLLPPEADCSGEISLNGRIISGLSEKELRRVRWEQVALVSQGAMNSFTPVLRIGTQICEILSFHLGLRGKELRQRTEELLRQAGLDSDIRSRYPHELSGGQKQRASIAAALACDPPYILADEPTTALDVITQSRIISTMVSIARLKRTGLLLVTHDISLASSISDEIAVMKDGVIVEKGDPGSIINEPRHSHTKHLVESLKKVEVER